MDAPIVLQNLRKEYPGSGGNPPYVAVHSMSLSVASNECFGLLGPNGMYVCLFGAWCVCVWHQWYVCVYVCYICVYVCDLTPLWCVCVCAVTPWKCLCSCNYRIMNSFIQHFQFIHCVYVCMHACILLCMCECVYVCVYVCMHVCMYVCVCVVDKVYLTSFISHWFLSRCR